MLKNHFGKALQGVTAIVAICTVLSVHAQTSGNPSTTSGQSSGQTTSGQGGTGQTGSGQAGSGQSGTGQTGSGQTGSGQAGSGQSGTGQTGTTATTDPQSSTATGAATARSAGPMTTADQRMLKTMAINNLAEIEAGRMAQSKTQSDEVRTFAQRMIDDHTKALDDVRQLAQTKGVALPTELDATNKRKAARLAALSGDAFDRAYMSQAGVADHKRNHALLRQAQSRAKDPDLQALAARTLPVVDQHLHSAQELHKNTARGGSRTQGQTGSSGCRQE